jgi:hypothetical protein
MSDEEKKCSTCYYEDEAVCWNTGGKFTSIPIKEILGECCDLWETKTPDPPVTVPIILYYSNGADMVGSIMLNSKKVMGMLLNGTYGLSVVGAITQVHEEDGAVVVDECSVTEVRMVKVSSDKEATG